MVQQTPLPFLDLIKLSQELTEVLYDVCLYSAEFSERISLASVVRKGVPSTGRAGNIDRAINPIERERNDPR